MRQAEIVEAYKAGQLSTAELKEQLRALTQQAAKMPLSEGQRGLWVLHKLSPEMSAYNVPVCLRVGRELDPAKLREACAFVLEQFPILTSVVEEANGAPFLASRPSSSPWFQVGILPPSLEPAEVLDHLRQLAKAPFDLEHGPLMRLHLITQARSGGRPAEQWVLLTMHHIVVDGRSLLHVVTTLLDAYLTLVEGQRPALAPTSASYADFVAWEQAMLAGDEGREHLAYWRQQLAGPLPVLELPGAEPRRAEAHRFEGSTHTRPLSPELSREIRAFAEFQDVNPSVVFLALFKVVLYRYSGQEDLIVGIPTMGRPQARFDGLVGYFVNMIALRSRVDGRRAFVDFIREVGLTLADALDHAAYPFPALVRELNVPRRDGRSPVFQLCFAYQNFVRHQELEAFGRQYEQPLALEFVDGIHQEGEFDLTLEILEQSDRFVLKMKYDPELYEATTVERMLGHLVTLAQSAIREPGHSLGAYPLRTAEEEALLVRDRVEADAPPRPTHLPAEVCLHEVFAAQARATPDAVAVTCEGESLTYAVLEARSTTLACYLQQHGVGPESLVGISVERSLEMSVGLLGILKAGGAYVPLDPAYPPERLAFMIRDSGVRLILTQATQAEKLASLAGDVRLIVLDGDWQTVERAVRQGEPRVLRGAVGSQQLAYVIYTSGSTGTPKGTLVQHDHVVRLFATTDRYFHFDRADVWTLFHSLSFDFSVWELWGALLYGGRLVIVPEAVRRTPKELYDLVVRERVTVLNQVPSAFIPLIKASRAAERQDRSLRYVIFGGEALAIPRLQPWFERFGDTHPRLINMYGITETTVHVTYYEVTLGDTEQGASLIGRPIPDLTLDVLDRHGHPTPIGVPGELYVGGKGVTRGYLQRPGLTAERFLPHPYEPGGRRYRTGDLARWRPNTEGRPGAIEYLGRVDDQVKLRGFRIELGDIEHQVLGHPRISDCVIVVKEEAHRADGSEDHKQLIAYYVPSQPGAVQARELRERLHAALPEYMMPSAFIELASIPLTLSGKVDRRALSEREVIRPADRAIVPPQSALEARVLAIWRAVLHTDQVGVEDGFFDAGGDSILLVAVADRIKEELGDNVRLAALFQYPTVRQFSAHLAAARGVVAEQPEHPPVSRIQGEVISPCPPQEDGGSAGERRPDLPPLARSLSPAGSEGKEQHAPPSQPAVPEYYQDSLAIIGISCQFPGAPDHFRFWQNLRSGTESVRFFLEPELTDLGVPADLIKDPHYIPVQASIDGKELFDPGFFNMSPRDAALMDPQFRLLLLHAWGALEDAGYTPEEVADTAVFVSASSVFERPSSPEGSAPDDSEGYVSWVLGQGGTIPTMISHKLGLTGPSFFIQANCSSSLVGLYAAWQCLKSGEAAHALVGGCTVFPTMGVGYLHQNGLNFSSDGHIKAFDADADGMIGGEGVAVILLKRAVDAARDGDHIYALLRGISANNDGAGKVGFYAPSVNGQAAVIQRVIETTGINPASIGYVEAHGTGTKLGDLVEITALREVYRQYTASTRFCGIGSVKTNIGHTDTVAGLAGCIKVALSLYHNQIPPSLNYRTPHPELDLEHSPFYVVDRLTGWDEVAGSAAPPRAALSSFGIGGTNVHAILEQAPPRHPTPESHLAPVPLEGEVFLVPLSAKADDRLRDYALKLLEFLAPAGPGATVNLADLSYTLQVGREAMRHRVAFLVSHIEELRSKLAGFAAGRGLIVGCVRGDVRQSRETVALFEQDEDSKELIRQWFAKGRLDKVADLWVKGLDLDWSALYTDSGMTRPHRISLPTYPFAREPFWVPGGKAPVAPPQPATAQTALLCPVWEPIVRPSPDAPCFPATTDRIAIIGGGEEAIDAIRHHYPQARVLAIRTGDDIDRMARALESGHDGPTFDHLFWIAPRCEHTPFAPESLVGGQDRGVLHLFRTIKALLQLGYGTRTLGLSLITDRTLAVHRRDVSDPTHAGLHGLVGCLAKEYPDWQIRFTDLDGGLDPARLTDLCGFPPDPAGEALVRRGASWFRQRLVPLHPPAAEAVRPPDGLPLHRRGGVYVVIGGAGGIGSAWSEYMIRAYEAHIVWIGRRQIDASIEVKIEQLARLGPTPHYLSADARDPEALQRAYDLIKQRHDRIHGVVHSAIVLLDQSLANMDEERFRAAFSAKVDICAAVAHVFRDEPLDLVLFFSALTGFFKPAGQGNYAAGCTFQDAFAQRLAREWTGTDGRPAVKVMNWGYWGNVGVVASKAYRARTARAGIGSIEPPEGMAALETLLAVPLNQVALWKTVGAGEEPEASVTIYPDTLPSIAGTLPLRVARDTRAPVPLPSPQECDSGRRMEGLLGRLLLAQLRTLGCLTSDRSGTLLATYDSWLAESLAVLVRQGFLYYDERRRACLPASADAANVADELAEAWRQWDGHKGAWLADPDSRAAVVLVDTTMRALADILTGKRRATDVIFPNSSVTLVEGTNQRNKIADFFNGVLADTVIAYIRERQARGAEALRLLEIGAGTGGTSAMVLAKLRELGGHPVREYCYTDVSRGFLLHGERAYAPSNPFLTYRTFDVEEPLAHQGIPAGEFDVVIAANVLHATSNVRRSLRNTKAALKKHGLLLLNEMSANTLFSHLTYGLLEGWWSYDDAELRLPGCPALSAQSWRSVLEEEGFGSIFFPTDDTVDLGLQVIVAESDGIVYQRTQPSRSEPAPRAPRHVARGAEKDIPVGQASSAAPVTPLPDATWSAKAHGRAIEAHVRDTIIRQLSESLGIDASKIDMGEPFADYGIDSLTGVHLVRVLNSLLNTDLETISLFDYSTVEALTGYIMAQYGDVVRAAFGEAAGTARTQDPAPDPQARDAITAAAPFLASGEGSWGAEPAWNQPQPDSRPECEGPVPLPSGQHDLQPTPRHRSTEQVPRQPTPFRHPDGAVAVIGMSARFAKSSNVKAFWENLAAGADLVEEVSRWDLSRYYPDSAAGDYCRHGSFLDDIDRFDPFFFNISGLEASYMDPQQRLFLEECWKALEDAGYAGGESAVQRPTMATTVGERRCGVYVGWCGVDYAFLLGDNPPPQAHWGTTGSVIPARIAYFLDLHGPAVAVDTACSSSLVAVHLACRGLLAGEMDMALAGGVSVQTTPASFLTPNKGGMLSHTGRCYTFDERADGFVLGEGVGVVVLKRLADAVAARDNIYGVIRGSALNQDGKTNGITAPSARSQERLAREVYETFKIDPARIGMVEAHGTGTRLGDPIEFEALTRAFRKDTDRMQYCAIGSVKTNLGHTIAAAGVAGLIKVLLALRHKKIPASLHYRKGNPNIHFEDSPFYVNTRLRDWEAETDVEGQPYPRLAVLSSFGFSGTNAHMAVEEAPTVDRTHRERPGYLIVLSARSPDQLRRQAEQLVAHLNGGTDREGGDCGNISYTLLLGRKHFNHRLACIARDTDELASLLEQWLAAGQQGVAGVARIHVSDLDGKDRLAESPLKRYGEQCIRACETAVAGDSDYLEHLSAVAALYIQGCELEYERLFAGDRYSRIPLPTYPFARQRYWVRGGEGDGVGDSGTRPPTQRPDPGPFSVANGAGLTPGAAMRHADTHPSREDFELMLFEETWQEEALPGASVPVLDGTVVCFLSDPMHQAAVRRVFDRLGGGHIAIVFIAQGHAPRHEAVPGTHVISPAERHTYETAFRRLREEGHQVEAILYLWPLEDPACIRDYTPVVYLLQAMVAAQLRPARLILAGQCAPGQTLDRCYLESWIGFERSLGLVLPHTQVAPVYAAASGDPAGAIEGWAARLWHELRTPKACAVMYQDGRRHVCGILPRDLTPGSDPWRAHGTYLITGGLGGLGLLFAHHLAAARPVNLILTGRSAVSAAQQARVDELEALGARVSLLRADVADRMVMRQGLAAAQARFGSINGIIHAAGVVGGCSLFEKDIEHFRRVLAPKVQGTLVLDELVDREALDFVCYFSSSAAILGDFGSCDYAIGNRFQMAFARYQAQRSGREQVKALAINWPLWGGIGMGAGDEEHIRMMLKSSGQRHLADDEGLALFDRILAQGAVHPLVLAGQPSRVRRFLGLAHHQPHFDGPHRHGHGALSHREGAADEDPQSPGNARHPLPMGTGQSWASRNQGDDAPVELGAQPRPDTAVDATPTQPHVSGTRRGGRQEMRGLSLHECVVWDLREHAAQLLQTPREQLRPDENLADFGFDSLSLTDFASRLTEHYNQDTSPVNITPSLLFGYPTFDKLAAFLLREYGPALAEFYQETASTPSQATMLERKATRPAPRPTVYAPVAADGAELEPWSGGEEPIAIIGMSGRFPQARNVDEMWEILINGRDAVAPFPDDRFDWWQFHGGAADRAPARPIHKGEAAAWSCGCIPGVGEFDPLFFEISPVEAEVMDPRQRLLLQEAWNALEDAGYGKSAIEAQTIGIFVGAEQGDYQWLSGGKGGVTASHDAMLAARLAYFLNLSGPVLTINTACSSGLVAAHQACVSLRNRECDTALAAGVTLVLIPSGLKGMSEAGMLSGDGRCRAFDRHADGIVPGEAVAVLVLKRLSRAQADGDPILAVIRGSGINYDGKTNGITAPSGVSQANLLTEVYRRYRVDSAAIEYVVTHGTGTKLGDPIEVNALNDAFKAARVDPAQPLDPGSCALTSAKTNFGHTFAASGLVSLISLVQAMRHDTIPASLHCEEENEFIDWRDSPFYVNRANRPWPRRQTPRTGAVSAFGVSGTNAHVVVESYEPSGWEDQDDPDRAPCYLLALSARTREALQAKTDGLIDLLQRQDAPLNLARISYTLLEGRHHFAHRRAVVIQDSADAVYALQQAGVSEKRPNLFQGVVPRDFSGLKATERYAEELVTRLGGAEGEMLKRDGDGFREILCALADLYCQGYAVPWRRMFRAGGRVHLPTYPFSRAEYWVPDGEGHASPPVGPISAAQLHPLLHQNTSDLTRQRFTSSFTGEEFFLADHRVNGRRVLPGVAYLEMARAAVEYALGDSYGTSSRAVRFEDVAWLRPFSLDEVRSGGEARLHIAVIPEPYAASGETRLRYECYSDAEGGAEGLLAQGHAVVRPATDAPALDLEALRAHCAQRLSGEECYRAFTSAGLDYGPSFRGLDTLFVGADLALARLSLPSCVADPRFVLHPSLLDAALQGCLALVAGVDEPNGGQAGVGLPFALDALEIFGACAPVMWSVARFSPGAGPASPVRKLDIDLCDEAGEVRVRLQGFSTRAAERSQQPQTGLSTVRALMLTPVWDPVALDRTQPAFSAADDRILVVVPAGETTLGNAMRQRYLAAETLTLDDGATIDTIAARLQALGVVDHVFWLAPPPRRRQGMPAEASRVGQTPSPLPPGEGPGEDLGVAGAYPGITLGADALVDGQERGVLQVFRLIKALLRTGCGDRTFALTALTTLSLPVCNGDGADPTHAGVHGLIGSLAKEYPHWRVRCLDLDDLPTADAAARVVDGMVHLKPDPEGNTRAYRLRGEDRHAGQWFHQQLLPLVLPDAPNAYDRPDVTPTITPHGNRVKEVEPTQVEQAVPPFPPGKVAGEDDAGADASPVGVGVLPPPGSRYRRGGVYVVIGGAGGIGEVWSEYMMRTYGARIVWIGRRQKDQAIQAKLDRLAELGPAPLYLAADATDRAALERACRAIKREHDRIHGVVHAAIVLLDKSLANMDEADFRAGLAAKVDVCVRLAQVFAEEPLDFALFFSSMTAFSKAAGQSNYAAGCAFKDAFARQLGRVWARPDGGPLVKVINWGYWGHVGIVSAKAYQERMAQAGVGSIEPDEGMAALESLLAGPVDQVAFLKMTRAVDGMDRAASVTVYRESAPSCIGALRARPAALTPSDRGLIADTGLTAIHVRQTVLEAASTVLGVDQDALDLHADLNEYGFDVLALTRLADLLNQTFGLGEPGPGGLSRAFTAERLLHDRGGVGPTLDGLAEYLLDEHVKLSTDGGTNVCGRHEVHQVRQEGGASEAEASVMEELICRLVWGQLRTVGFFRTPEGAWRPAGWPALYERWLEETIAVLVGKHVLQYVSHGPVTDPFAVANGPGILATSMDAAAFWREWNHRKEPWLADTDKRALVILLETTLRALPEILSGTRPATDVIFPNSSMELVEDIYKHNEVADRFNAILADTVIDYIRERRVDGAPAGLRLLEIGAGTGGTSAMVFRKLRGDGLGSSSYRDDILEYCYTDISRAFLMHAEREYGPHNPYLTYRLFNVEQPVAPQGIGAARYDLVIAANVLHATQDIRRTLRNAKALLRPNGLLLLNELSTKSLFTHLTFGLLEGWWRYEDVPLRQPGCPALDPVGWRWVLEEEGFRSVWFPAESSHHLGQQVIVAESDGIVRQEPAAHQSGARAAAPYSISLHEKALVGEPGHPHRPTDLPDVESGRLPLNTAVPMAQPEPPTPGQLGHQVLRDRATAYVRALVGETLKIPAAEIDPAAPLEAYGIDSILVVRLANRFREVFDNITSTLFFEYQTVDALVGYLLETRREALVALVGGDKPLPPRGGLE